MLIPKNTLKSCRRFDSVPSQTPFLLSETRFFHLDNPESLKTAKVKEKAGCGNAASKFAAARRGSSRTI